MVAITLLPEQIREAPPEVRRWLEQQITGAWPGLYRAGPTLEPPARHLVACSLEDARAILSLIHEVLPVVSVFFELGREPVAVSAPGLRALRLDDMLRHSRLPGAEQVIACLKIVDEALQRVRGEPDAALTALDGEGHCVVADATARSILELWQEIVASRELAQPSVVPGAAPQAAAGPFQAPFSISAPPFVAPQATGRSTG